MVPGAGEHVVGCELEIEVLPSQQSIHEHDELQDELVLTEVVPQLEHHLGGEGRGGEGRGGEGRGGEGRGGEGRGGEGRGGEGRKGKGKGGKRKGEEVSKYTLTLHTQYN